MATRVRPLFLIGAWLFLVAFSCSHIDPHNTDPDKSAPKKSIEARHQWGLKALGEDYVQTVLWLKSAPFVSENLGKVIKVAPVDKPNYLTYFSNEGALGKFTLEVKGERGTARCVMSGVFPSSPYGIGFESCRWTQDEKVVMLDPSGLSVDQAQRPESRIADANRRMGASAQEPASHPLYAERAEAEADLGQYDRAILDMRTAIGFLKKVAGSNVNGDGEKEFTGWNETSSNKYREYLRRLAVYRYFSSSFAEAEEDMTDALSSPFAKGTLTTDRLWIWVVGTRAGKGPEADKALASSLAEAEANGDFCWEPFAKFLLGRMTEEAFVALIESDGKESSHAECDNVVGKRSPAMAYYYVAEKRAIKGDHAGALSFFRRAVTANKWNKGAMEMRIAQKMADSAPGQPAAQNP